MTTKVHPMRDTTPLRKVPEKRALREFVESLNTDELNALSNFRARVAHAKSRLYLNDLVAWFNCCFLLGAVVSLASLVALQQWPDGPSLSLTLSTSATPAVLVCLGTAVFCLLQGAVLDARSGLKFARSIGLGLGLATTLIAVYNGPALAILATWMLAYTGYVLWRESPSQLERVKAWDWDTPLAESGRCEALLKLAREHPQVQVLPSQPRQLYLADFLHAQNLVSDDNNLRHDNELQLQQAKRAALEAEACRLLHTSLGQKPLEA